MPDSSSTTLYDVLIIGAGPGGLATVTALARQLRTAVVFDSGLYRNARATHMHNYLGFDHVSPAEFRSCARADLRARYDATTTLVDREVLRVVKASASSGTSFFKATDVEGKIWHGRKLVLATGVTDLLPSESEIPGFADCWGRCIFHCLFCHGFESRGTPSAGVMTGGLASGSKMAMHIAWMAQPLAKQVNIYTNGNETMANEVQGVLSASTVNPPFRIDSRKVVRVEKGQGESDIVLHFEDGTTVTEGFLAYAPKTRVNGPFADQLGLELAPNGDVKTINMFNETSVPGVYAAGDCGQMAKAVPTAAASGAMVAAGMSALLGSEPTPEIS